MSTEYGRRRRPPAAPAAPLNAPAPLATMHIMRYIFLTLMVVTLGPNAAAAAEASHPPAPGSPRAAGPPRRCGLAMMEQQQQQQQETCCSHWWLMPPSVMPQRISAPHAAFPVMTGGLIGALVAIIGPSGATG
jgi:hypothetical protein